MTAWICSFHFVQFCTCKRKFKGTVPWDFRLQVFFHESVSPKPLSRVQLFSEINLLLVILVWPWNHKNVLLSLQKTLYTISWDYPFKVEWMDFWKEICKNLFFDIEFSQNQLSHLFLKHFHRNSSIYKITTPLLRSEGGNLQTDASQLFLFDPIPAKAKKLGLLSIYKFSLPHSLARQKKLKKTINEIVAGVLPLKNTYIFHVRVSIT